MVRGTAACEGATVGAGKRLTAAKMAIELQASGRPQFRRYAKLQQTAIRFHMVYARSLCSTLVLEKVHSDSSNPTASVW